MPNPNQSHMDVEPNLGAQTSSYQWNRDMPKKPHKKNQGCDADDDLDGMPDFAAMIADFQGPDKEMVGYKDLPTIEVDSDTSPTYL
jgi:hypothetical protein